MVMGLLGIEPMTSAIQASVLQLSHSQPYFAFSKYATISIINNNNNNSAILLLTGYFSCFLMY